MPIRVVPADDPERFLRTDLLVWADGRSADPTEQVLRGIAEQQRFAALSDEVDVDPTTYAGIYGVYDLELGVPGPRHGVSLAPAAGLTWVGVHPDARRRGVLTTMIRDHLARAAAAEVSGLSLLHASEPTIYGRFGYGIASRRSVATVDIGTKLTAPGLEEAAAGITTRLVTAGQGDAAARAFAASRGRRSARWSASSGHWRPSPMRVPRCCATRSRCGSSSRVRTARTSATRGSAASPSGPTTIGPKARSRSSSSEPQRPNWL